MFSGIREPDTITKVSTGHAAGAVTDSELEPFTDSTIGTATVSGVVASCCGAPQDQQKFALALRISPQRRQVTGATVVRLSGR
jgi:hypothetical protein